MKKMICKALAIAVIGCSAVLASQGQTGSASTGTASKKAKATVNALFACTKAKFCGKADAKKPSTSRRSVNKSKGRGCKGGCKSKHRTFKKNTRRAGKVTKPSSGKVAKSKVTKPKTAKGAKRPVASKKTRRPGKVAKRPVFGKNVRRTAKKKAHRRGKVTKPKTGKGAKPDTANGATRPEDGQGRGRSQSI